MVHSQKLKSKKVRTRQSNKRLLTLNRLHLEHSKLRNGRREKKKKRMLCLSSPRKRNEIEIDTLRLFSTDHRLITNIPSFKKTELKNCLKTEEKINQTLIVECCVNKIESSLLSDEIQGKITHYVMNKNYAIKKSLRTPTSCKMKLNSRFLLWFMLMLIYGLRLASSILVIAKRFVHIGEPSRQTEPGKQDYG